MQHKETNIQTIKSITAAIANPASGDYLFVDIDETLLLTGINKYADTPQLTESGLPAEIKRLHERGIKVIGLTARKEKYRAATLQQLKKLGITLSDIIFAPSEKITDGSKLLRKAPGLQAYLSQCEPQPQRIFIFDNDLAQLQHLQQAFAATGTQVHLKHYQPRHDQPIAIYQPHQHLFPAELNGFHVVKALGGGTNSVFSIRRATDGQQFVLKFGAHDDAGKIEMLCNVVYQALGVKVPRRCVYRGLPTALVKDLNINAPAGMYQVSEFIRPHQQQSPQLIRNAVRKDFAAHVLLGNIDVAKEDNFIVDQHGNTVLIDAGANFLFRAKGETRKEHAALASEIDTLRDEKINASAHAWFAGLTEAEIAIQVQALVAKHAVMEQAVWDAANQLELPEELRNHFLNFLSDRLDHLVTRFCHVSQQHAKTDKKSHEKKTAAGVLTYTMKNGEPHVLLSQRTRHRWWDNFGGKSEQADHYLVDTARREVAEESSQQLNYTTQELNVSPCHDLVTGEGANQKIYRLYLSPYREIKLALLNDAEHSAHQWVPLAAIMQAVTTGQSIVMEGVNTVEVKHGKQSLPLFPPLFQMLKQPAVRDNLQALIHTGKMKATHTLGFADNIPVAGQELAYLPLVTPVKKRQQIAAVIKHKSVMLREMKGGGHTAIEKRPAMPPQFLTQSEVHIKSILGAKYREGRLEDNVRLCVSRIYSSNASMCSREQQDRITRIAVSFIENERNGGEDQFYFYHGCSNKISFAYEIYTRLYQALHADNHTAAFRPDSEHFQRFLGITEFIAFYSMNNQKSINNNDDHFHDCALSANVFLFGNYQTPTSSSIHYLVNNEVRREIDLELLFTSLLRPFHVSAEEIKRLLQVFETCAKYNGGSLYQIAMSKEQAQQMAYPAGHMGKLLTLDDVRDLPCIMLALQNRDLTDRTLVKYLEELQARLLVPPQLKLRVNTVKWESADQVKEQQYHHELQQCADFIFDLILRHHGAAHNEHNSTAVLKVLPAILAANQVSASATVTAEVLVRAITANDAATVTNILQSHPEFLEETFSLPAQYIKGDRNQDRGNLHLIDLILHHSRLTFSVLPVSYVTRELQNFAAAGCQKGEIELNKIISRLPEAERYPFAMQMASNYSLAATDLFRTIEQLPDHSRMSFIKDLRPWHHWLHRSAYENYVKLISSVPYQDMLECLPLQQRARFARSIYTISKWRQVAAILEMLPDNERLDYLNFTHRGVTPNVIQLVGILPLLPEHERLGYVVGYQHLIATGASLGGIIELLPLEDREAFVRHHEACIKNGDDLHSIVRHLSTQDALAYTRRYIKYIKEAKCLCNILACLPQTERGGIAIASKIASRDHREFARILAVLGKDNWPQYFASRIYMPWINKGSILAEVIRVLPEDGRLALATLLYRRVKDFSHMLEIINALPQAVRLPFLDTIPIDNFSKLADVLPLLPDEACTPWAYQKQSLITNIDNVTEVLKLLPVADRMDFALANRRFIAGAKDICLIMPQLQPKFNIEFANQCCHLITDAEGLGLVLGKMDRDDRPAFLARNRHHIHDTRSLDFVVVKLWPWDRNEFILTCEHLLKNIYDLVSVLRWIKPEARLSYAAAHYKLMNGINDVNAVHTILKYLHPSQVLEFVQPLLNKAENIKLYYLVLNYLPDSQRLEFVKSHYQNILEFCSLEQITRGKPDAERDELSYCKTKKSQKSGYGVAGAGMKFFHTEKRTPQAIDAFLGNTILSKKNI